MPKAALATVALLAMCVARAEAQADLTEIPVPFLFPGDPLEPHPAGILFQARPLYPKPKELPSVYLSKGTATSTRRLVVPGRRVLSLLGYRGRHVFLNAATTESAPTEVFSLDLSSARALRLVAGHATHGTAAEPAFFFVLESGAAPGLYSTDGTPAGTRLVFPGPIADVVSIERAILFFSPLEGDNGHALYRARGTRVEKLGEFPLLRNWPSWDYLSYFPISKAQFLAPFGGRAVFHQFRQDRASGEELWISDGTVGGTRLLHLASEYIWHPPVTCGDQLLFFGGNYPFVLRATDGSLPGTRSLTPPVWEFLETSFQVVDAGGICYFHTRSFPGPHMFSAQLWRTDLTPAGTSAISIDQTRMLPEARASGARGRVYFPKEGELWVSDGTEEGTRSLASGFISAPSQLVHSAGRLFFETYDSNLETSSLWAVHLPPALEVEDAEVVERPRGVGAMTFHVRLSRSSPTPVVVQYETEAGTATPGEDFVIAAGSLVFSPGERLKLVRVSIVGDGVPEGAEHLALRLTDAVGAEIERGLGMGTIRDPERLFRATPES